MLSLSKGRNLFNDAVESNTYIIIYVYIYFNFFFRSAVTFISRVSSCWYTRTTIEFDKLWVDDGKNADIVLFFFF